MGPVYGLPRHRQSVTDPIECPECGGRKGQRIGGLFLGCRFCGGLGWVGGDNEPAERGADLQAPPLPPAWQHRVWQDPFVSAAFPCRLCFGSGSLTHVDAQQGTLITIACACVEEVNEV